MRGNGGTWNRAGRRSGGARPVEIVVPPVITCAACQTATAFGLLPESLIELTIAVKCCPSCDGILLVRRDGRWITAADFMGDATNAG